MKKNKIPELPSTEFTTSELRRKKELMSKEVQQIIINESGTLIKLIDAYAKSSFQARNLGLASHLYYKQSLSPTGIIWSLAGSLFGAGLRQITINAIRNNLVDILVCTGALFEQDML